MPGSLSGRTQRYAGCRVGQPWRACRGSHSASGARLAFDGRLRIRRGFRPFPAAGHRSTPDRPSGGHGSVAASEARRRRWKRRPFAHRQATCELPPGPDARSAPRRARRGRADGVNGPTAGRRGCRESVRQPGRRGTRDGADGADGHDHHGGSQPAELLCHLAIRRTVFFNQATRTGSDRPGVAACRPASRCRTQSRRPASRPTPPFHVKHRAGLTPTRQQRSIRGCQSG